VNVDRKLIKKIRAMLHDLNTNGLETATKKHFNLLNDIDEKYQSKFIHRLEGYINFVGQVRGINDALYIKQKKALVSYKNG
jgi:RNA-directed DNA polymerase